MAIVCFLQSVLISLPRIFVIASKCIPSLSLGSPAFSKPINFGTDGPNMSRSRSPTFGARSNGEVLSKERARLALWDDCQ